MSKQGFVVESEQAGKTVAAVLRVYLPGFSWQRVRRLIAGGRVHLRGELCLDPARRVAEGDRIQVVERVIPRPRPEDAVEIRYLDEHLVVVEKPAGIATVRHPAERRWSPRRKALHPTLEDILPALIARTEKRRGKGPLPRLRIVHRLDKGTSGLLVFARTVTAERGLGRQFHRHTIMRRYLAVVVGQLESRRIASRLVRDRGDGRRGSTTIPGVGKEAITHVEVMERLRGYSLVSCRLETGRTHQIRIHLAEAGHPVCGEKVYNRSRAGEVIPDASGAPRLALHAAELGFSHPATGQAMHWTSPLPADLDDLLGLLRGDRVGK